MAPSGTVMFGWRSQTNILFLEEVLSLVREEVEEIGSCNGASTFSDETEHVCLLFAPIFVSENKNKGLECSLDHLFLNFKETTLHL